MIDIIHELKVELRAYEDPVYFAEHILGIKLYPKQAEILKDFYDNNYRELIINAGMRCLTADTPVLTPDGYKPITEVSEVITPSGNIAKAKLIPQTIRPVFEITLSSGRSIKATLNHPILTNRGWMTVLELTHSPQIPVACFTHNHITYNHIKSITFSGFEMTYDMEVNHPDHAFIANGIIVHNSGKTTIASVIACYEAYRWLLMANPQKHYGLAPGQTVFIITIAKSEQQALDTIFARIKANIESSEWFQSVNMKMREKDVYFPEKKLYLRAEHSNSDSLPGRTCKAVIFDEMARFSETGGPASAERVYFTLTRATTTFGRDGKIIVISSPLYEDDFFYGYLVKQLKGREDDGIKVWEIPTWEMNPNLPFDGIDMQKERMKDEDAFWRDFGAKPQKAMERFFREIERIYQCVDDEYEHPVGENDLLHPDFRGDPRYKYYLAGDPAIKNDAFGFALVHSESDKIIVDMVHRMKPPRGKEISAEKVKRFVLDINDRFRLDGVVFDTWHYADTLQALKKQGIKVFQHMVSLSEYELMKELIYQNKLQLYNHPELLTELEQLEVRNGKKIDHPRRGSKDIADALANAIWLAFSKRTSSRKPVWVLME